MGASTGCPRLLATLPRIRIRPERVHSHGLIHHDRARPPQSPRGLWLSHSENDGQARGKVSGFGRRLTYIDSKYKRKPSKTDDCTRTGTDPVISMWSRRSKHLQYNVRRTYLGVELRLTQGLAWLTLIIVLVADFHFDRNQEAIR